MSDLNGMASPEAERLQSALDRLAAGEAWEDVAGLFDGAEDEVELAAFAMRAAQVCRVKAPPGMRARQQVALQAAFETERTESGRRARAAGAIRRSGSPRYRLFVVRFVSGLLALALATGSAVVASASSLPGEVLYPVKLAAESARIALSGSAAARATLRLELAGERLNEIRRLVDLGIMPSPRIIDAMLDNLASSEQEAEASGDLSLLRFARAEIDRHTAALLELARLTDATTRRMIETALGAVEGNEGNSAAEPPSDTSGSEPPHFGQSAPGGAANSTPSASDRGGSDFEPIAIVSPSTTPSPSQTPTSVGTLTPTPTSTSSPTPIESPPGGSGGSGGSTPPPVEPPTDPTSVPPDEPGPTPIPDNPRATERAREEPTPPPKVTPRGRPLPGDPPPPPPPAPPIEHPPGRP